MMISTPLALSIRPLPAFADNYIWWLARGRRAVAVDPGDAEPVLQALQTGPTGTVLDAILVTHHHGDHVGGVAALVEHVQRREGRALPVIGPADENIPGRTQAVQDGDAFDLLNTHWEVIGVPGHTLGHVAFHAPGEGLLLCGDTLFAGGCGRLFEGSAAQLYGSLQRLAALPDATRVLCAHEYTVGNLRFAQAAEPDNAQIAARLADCLQLRARGETTLPSTIGLERATNPFLRCGRPQAPVTPPDEPGGATDDPVARFAALRRWKDRFKPTVAPE
jgi:hydroxyacylglutathione hydrolase